MFRYVVLGLLISGSPRHGYALMKDYERRSGLRISSGTFYRELQHLAAEGLVRVVSAAPEVDHRRALYQITGAGDALLKEWLEQPTGNATGARHDELFARIILVGDADPATMRRGLAQWREELELLAETLKRALAEFADRRRDRRKEAHPIALMMERRLQHVLVDLWCVDELFDACEGARTATAGRAAQPTKTVPTTDARAPRRAAAHRPGGRNEHGETAPARARASERLAALRD